MGFYIARVMRFYSMSLSEALSLPARHFFWLWTQADRVEAQEAIQQIQILLCVNDQEALDAAMETLRNTRGVTEIYQVEHPRTVEISTENDGELDPEFDRQALRALKARHGV